MKTILFIILFSIGMSAAQAASPFVEQVKKLDQLDDDLGIRILVKKNYRNKMNIKDWDEIRKILKRRYAVGLDAVIAWDRQITITSTNLDEISDSYQKVIEDADKLMLQKKFAEAFDKYQEVARQAKVASRGKIEKANYHFYFNILHQMGRALYSMKRFDEAIEVYSWIPPVYFMARQVMFEKMWAGFRAGRYDIAMGAIASQKSAYFSTYADPEAYLVQIYMLKRLCRTEDIQRVVNSLKKYVEDIKGDRIPILDWAKSDILRFSMVNLINQKTDPLALKIVSGADRRIERQNILDQLRKKYAVEKPIVIGQLEKILGYAYLIISEDQKILSAVSSLPSSAELERKGYEFWPSGGGEEWFDEIGSHIFIGESKCTKAPRK